MQQTTNYALNKPEGNDLVNIDDLNENFDIIDEELKKNAKAKTNYGTCSTAAATAAKTIACDGYELLPGAEIVVKFTVTNTAANPTLNVAGTGAKPIYYRGAAITAGYLAANCTYAFRYNGTQYELVGDIDTNTTYTNAGLGQGYGTCETAAATAAKVVTISGYALKTGGIVVIKFTYGVPLNATLNINSNGAKAIFYQGVAIIANVIKAGDTATLIYDGTRYHVIAIDRDKDTTYGNMGGASENKSGTSGLVPAPEAGDQKKYLRADGTWQDLQGQLDEVNNKLNPLSAAYITGSIDETINKYADGAPYIFGHSETLNSLLGYWVIVITIGHVTQDNNKYYAQVAIGQNGKSATRFYTSSNSWSSWVS